MIEFLGNAGKLELILDVLRANEMHSSGCALLQTRLAQRNTGAYLSPPPCDCWLSAPATFPPLPESELRVDVFHSGAYYIGSGSVEANWPTVRIVHIPTGLSVSKKARSQLQAKAAALEEISRMHAELQKPL